MLWNDDRVRSIEFNHDALTSVIHQTVDSSHIDQETTRVISEMEMPPSESQKRLNGIAVPDTIVEFLFR